MISKEGADFMYDLILQAQPKVAWWEKRGKNFFYKYLKFMNLFTSRPDLMHCMYITNSNCTFKCRECHSYMPYFKRHYMSSFGEFKREMDNLLKAIGIIYCLRFQGGETLLTRDLPQMIEYAVHKSQILHIQIMTNGSIVPSQELLEAMKNPKVLFGISDYSQIEEVRPKLKVDEILRLCEEKGVNCQYYITPPGAVWNARYDIRHCKEVVMPEQAKENYKYCWCFGGETNPVFLFNGKLYLCPPAFYLDFNHDDFYIPPDEVIDIVNTPPAKLAAALNAFFAKQHYELCSRCNAASLKDVRHVPGEQLKKADVG